MNNRYKLLLVENDKSDSNLLKSALETAGYHVVAAHTCQQGKMLFSSYVPDLVLLEPALPDGLAFISQVRAVSQVPILVVSRAAAEEDKVAALDLGANDYVTKPYGMAELLARVRVGLRSRHSGILGGSYRLGELTIDYDRRQVAVGERRIRLTQTEYNILALLSQSDGRVLSYAAIIRSIWGSMDEGSIKKLQVNVANIRKKIGKPYLVNESCVGYRMKEE